MTLMLHSGANAVSYDELRAVTTPEPTESHVPIPHHEIVQLMRYTLGFHEHEIAEEHHAVTPDGARYFGLMCLRSPHGDYTDIRIKGPLATSWRTLTRENIVAEVDPDVFVESRRVAEANCFNHIV